MERAAGVEHVLRVAVTGITASGKSTLATQLTAHVAALGRSCVRIPADGFHNPRAVRYRRGRDSAEGYYRDAYDVRALVERVLVPLGPGGTRSYVSRVLDLDTDTPLDDPPLTAPPGTVAILDASFLLRPELRDSFDYRIFVETSFDEARARGVRRDCDALGGVEAVERLYRQRYHAAQRLYRRGAQPLRWADCLVVNDDVDAPTLFLRYSRMARTPTI